MSTAEAQVVVTGRKQEILDEAISIIANEGYANLTMRALARASDMKLGALQYHFRTWESLLTALADYIKHVYWSLFDAEKGRSRNLRDVVDFILDDQPGSLLQSDRLFPQLWAMARVEPVMESLLDEIYEGYLRSIEERLLELGSDDPRSEALVLMSLLEGSTLFVGEDQRWAKDAEAVRTATHRLIDARYGIEE